MFLKYKIVLVALFSGCLARPSLETDDAIDLSSFFDNVGPSTRIVGGSPAAVGSAPYMVALSAGDVIRNYQCGASLITPRTVLTAAHCYVVHTDAGMLSSSYRGIVGTNLWKEGGYMFAFERFVTHPDYSEYTLKNDLGLLVTAAPVPLSNLVQIMPLSFNHVDAGVQVRVTGWGLIRPEGPRSDNLLELVTSTMGGEECTAAFPSMFQSSIELCTVRDNRGICNSDSGSPLVRTDIGGQVGVVSWSLLGCGRGGPDVYVRLSAFRRFIETNAV
ncbi:unnamed protein product [Plutella xylostella]|uniref:(diamondback moth) hypothetical protein n=1 Tax=Plutella xylostella TaxID=51655 RepID=A0A8S4G5A9_PLUXY|nr:unnamed protein product [Plutella xylostella]